ncbi:hypothetical protein [Microbacterium sp. RG1]|uniref:hypothetical protein n=1 Tax=Microbacterium sp. RG1 TaxID=2489212 RepID=UPI0010CA41C7|nr:hypothetical protein [Microbacterium sp. RG1]QCQ16449.1 hypothetical protein EHF32_06745 [Microbacterium sp. RG1]
MTPRRRLVPPLAVAAAALALAGCTNTAGYTDLESTETRALPAMVTKDALAHFDLDSMRWVGEHEGTDVWLGWGRRAGEVCILFSADVDAWVTGCAGAGGQMTLSGRGPQRFVVVPDGQPAPEGFAAISHNVYVASTAE